VSTVAFEPVPANLFYLTSTLIRNPGLKALVSLRATGLSDQPGTATIYSQAGNAGNSVVGQPLADNPADAEIVEAMRQRSATIALSTLDEELWPDRSRPAPHIALMKVDVQGSEVRLFGGAARLLKQHFTKCEGRRVQG
jgi:FkbM family methyltransferase